MPVRNARKAGFLEKRSRAGRRLGLAALALLISCDALQNAIAEGDTRTIGMKHSHTGEEISITYKRNGRYDDQALEKLNWFLRDWRRDEKVRMEPTLIDALWEVHREVGAKEKILIICGYRAPETNSLLRRRSKGVAQTSHHMTGNAIDFYIPGVPLDELRAAGLRMQKGGVGYYPSSGSPFVHMDVGNVRHWPRMTHDQLAKVFPSGRTVHVPTDGKPLAGYQLALADLDKRGGSPSGSSLDAARSNGVDIGNKKNFLAKLFGFNKNSNDEEIEPDTPAATPAKAEEKVADATAAKSKQLGSWKRVPGLAPAEEPVKTAPVVVAVPLPKDRPSTYQLAAVLIPPERPPAPIPPKNFAANTPNDIINTRGFWTGLPDSAAATDSSRRRPVETASADPAGTASIGPFPAPDRKPADALAYAAPVTPVPPSRPAPPATIPRQTAAAASVALKREEPPAASLGEIAAALPPTSARPAQRNDDPWTRATVLTPSVERFLNATLFGMPDFRNLQPLLMRPRSSVVMTFSADPHLGMTTTSFSGPAVVFVATMSFSNQSAALR